MRVSTQGEWSGWLEYFLSAIAGPAREAQRRANRLQALREDCRVRVTTARASSLLTEIRPAGRTRLFLATEIIAVVNGMAAGGER